MEADELVPLPLSSYEADAAGMAPEPEPEPPLREAPRHLQPRPVGAEPAPPPLLAPVAPAPPSRLGAGLTVVAAAGAAALGYYLGRGWGAAAGALYVGAGRNALRTCRIIGTDTTEATKSGTVALFGLAGAGYLTYRAYAARSDHG